jgi:hypothetical protein
MGNAMPDNQPGYPRFRRRDIPRHSKVVLVRGDAEDPEIDRGQAQDFLDKYPRWGRFGLSAYYAADDAAIDDLASDLLERFEALLLYPLEKLVGAGFEVVATFRTPHVTIAFTDLDQGLRLLDTTEHEVRPNPYHGTERRTP